MAIEVKRETGYAHGIASIYGIEVSIVGGYITSNGVLTELFSAVLNLVDPGYIDPDEIEELFKDALRERFPL